MFVNSTTKTYDFSKLKEVTKIVTCNLDKMIDVNLYPLEEAAWSSRHRAIGKFIYTLIYIYFICNLYVKCTIFKINFWNILGIGVTGLADAFISMRYPFESKEAKKLNVQIFETLYYGALEASCEMAIENGPYETYKRSPVSEGVSKRFLKAFFYWLLDVNVD